MKRLMVAATLTAGMVLTAMPAGATTAAPKACVKALDAAEEIYVINADTINVAVEMIEYLDPAVPYNAATEASIDDELTFLLDELDVAMADYDKYSARCRAAS